MNTKEIFDSLNRDKFTRHIFLGVFAVNQLPKSKVRVNRWCLICNCCPKHLPEKHWLSIFYENNQLEFFDSFGLPPLYYGSKLDQFVRVQCLQSNNFIFNDCKLQRATSSACGHYCILFLFQRARKRNQQNAMDSIISEFSKINRDHFIIYLANTWFGQQAKSTKCDGFNSIQI